jgi:hypothetical protein
MSPVGGVSGAGIVGDAGSAGGVVACANAALLINIAAARANDFIAKLLILYAIRHR